MKTMRPEYRLLVICLLLLSTASLATSQEAKPQIPLDLQVKGPCGDPLTQSDFYFYLDGYNKVLVSEVIDGQTIIVTLGDGKSKLVTLGGIDAPDVQTQEGRISQQYLSGLVLRKSVAVLLHGSSTTDKSLGGRISLQTSPSDVNLAMIEAGMGRYKESNYLTTYDKCRFKLAAENSKRAKKGLWQSYFVQ
jgi:endonuclease YncB( thermonuclease family)